MIYSSRQIVAVILLSVTAFTSQAQGPAAADTDIRAAIQDEFRLDGAVPSDAIGIVSEDGVVTLEGIVPNLRASARAKQIVTAVRGVRAVIDRLVVAPTSLSREQIIAAIGAALLFDPVTERQEINFEVNEPGGVTLMGDAESWAEKSAAEFVVESVAGVTSVRNEIEVEHAVGRRTDSDLENEIRYRMRWDVLLDDELVDVRVHDGRVYLTGVVGSAAEKLRSESDSRVVGVSAVDSSGLEVRSSIRRDGLRRTKYVLKSDEEIRRAIQAAFTYDPRVLSFNVEVSVRDGAVVLDGLVDTLRAKYAAEGDARNTVGVTAVENRLEVRPSSSEDDQVVAAAIRAAMRRSALLSGQEELSVDVVEGQVNLFGRVDTFADRLEAEAIAAQAPGAIDVHNHLSVISASAYPGLPYATYPYNPVPTKDYIELMERAPREAKSDDSIKSAVESQLYWNAFVDAYEVTVAVDNGVVTLSGEISTAREHAAAIGSAFDGGAQAVDDQLRRTSQGAGP